MADFWFLAAAWEAANDAKVITGPDGTVLAANPAYLRLFGYPEAAVVGHPFTLIYPEAERAAYMARYLAAFHAPRPPDRIERAVRRADGALRTVEVWVSPLERDGRRYALLSVMRDVTEQRRAEAERDRTARRLGLVLDSITDGFLSLDRAWRFTFVNPRAEALLDRPRAALLGRGIWAELPELVGTRFYQECQTAAATGQTAVFEATYEPVARRLLVRVYPSEEGLAVFFLDVTERHRREVAQRVLAEASAVLAESLDYAQALERLAALVVPALADYCVVDLVDPDGSVRDVAVAHTDPARRAEIMATRRRFPPDPIRPNSLAARVIRTGRPEVVPVVTDTWHGGLAMSAEQQAAARGSRARSVLCAPLVARGRTLGAITFGAYTPGRYTERDLDLAVALAGRCALAIDNARLYGAAQAALRTRDDLIATVSHDLKNPLTVMRGLAQLIERRAARDAGEGAAWIAERARQITDAAEQMRRLIDELTDIARLKAGSPLELRLAPTDLVRLVRARIDAFQQQTDGHQLQFEAAVPELTGEWDADRLTRVIDNLLSNAIKYSPAGGLIRVVVARQAVGERTMAVLSVADQGIGIPADELPRIFERFHRGRNVVGRFEGSGVGLSGARQIVAQHGGTFSVESHEGAGSTFTIRLPLAPPNQAVEAAAGGVVEAPASLPAPPPPSAAGNGD